MSVPSVERAHLGRILRDIKRLAKEYRSLTGRPLGVTGEVAELEAARLIGLTLCAARTPGYDATCRRGGRVCRVQIKGRVILPSSKRGQRLGRIKVGKEWDVVALVLLDEHLNATHIYEAPRAVVEAALRAPGSKARNERGALSISKFKSIGKLKWSKRTDA